MPIDAYGRYSATHKTWDHVGNVIPDIEHSEGIRPHGEFMPASWLPVQFYDKYYENWYTVMPGKLIAFDNQGRLVPAQYGLSGATITYTQNDVDAGVIDVRTGATLLVAAIGTFNVSAVTDFMGLGLTLAVSKPAGVAPYGYIQWAGDGTANDDGFNPVGYRQHNYNMQHRTALLCDYVIELPLVPAVASSENMTQDSYSSNVVTFTALSNLPVATNTVRTTIAFANGTRTDAATRFALQVSTLAEVDGAGDWHIDYTTGVISAYSVGTLGPTNIYTITYYHYNSSPSTVGKFAQASGNLTAGDFVKCDSNSNFVVAVPKTYGDGATDNFDTFADIMGQVIEVENVRNKDGLDKVRTAYSSLSTSATGSLPAYAGQMDQMPGSATGGVPDNVHYAGAADKVVRINLVSR